LPRLDANPSPAPALAAGLLADDETAGLTDDLLEEPEPAQLEVEGYGFWLTRGHAERRVESRAPCFRGFFLHSGGAAFDPEETFAPGALSGSLAVKADLPIATR
jgi:hypothetical protein